MKNRNRLMPLVALSLLLVSLSPIVSASTLKVTLNPTTRTADLVSNSSTTMVLTYPTGSFLSRQLSNYSTSSAWTGNFRGVSDGAGVLQRSLDEDGPNLRVQSMNVSYSLKATGNATALVVEKATDISAVVLGAFTVNNGTVVAHLGWKAFRIAGEMPLDLGGHIVDVNLVGSTMGEDRPIAGALVAMFGGYQLWNRPTLDFSALNAPLSNWTSSYDPVTNTTVYSKTISGQSNLNASADYNGQRYTLSVISDPSAQVAVQGYAVASGDSHLVEPAPASTSPIMWVAGGAVIVAALGAAVYVLRRARRRTNSSPSSQISVD